MSRSRKRVSSKGKALFADNATVKTDSTGRISTGPQTSSVIAGSVAAEAAARAAADLIEASDRAAADAALQAQINAFDSAANPPVFLDMDGGDNDLMPIATPGQRGETGLQGVQGPPGEDGNQADADFAAIAGSAAIANQVNVTDAGNANVDYFVALATSASGQVSLQTDSGIKYNPNTDLLDVIATRSTLSYVYDTFYGTAGYLAFFPGLTPNSFDLPVLSTDLYFDGLALAHPYLSIAGGLGYMVADLTYATGLPLSTGLSGLGSNVAAFLAEPYSRPPVFFQENDVETSPIIPGPQGAIGPQGITGNPGMDGDSAFDDIVPPYQNSMEGITGTFTQFNTACSDEDFAPFGGLPIMDTTITRNQTIGETQQCVTFGPITVTTGVITVNGPWILLSRLTGI